MKTHKHKNKEIGEGNYNNRYIHIYKCNICNTITINEELMDNEDGVI